MKNLQRAFTISIGKWASLCFPFCLIYNLLGITAAINPQLLFSASIALGS